MIPTIVVATYNRLESLKRLFNSLLQVNFSGFESVRLVISVDKHPTDEKEIVDYCSEFDWPFGEKRIRTFEERQGLKKHFIACGDLTKDYDEIIFLEDDFLISSNFFHYAAMAIKFYKDDLRIAGIALYELRINEFSNRVFTPIVDMNDQYFIQLPSWGKVFNRMKWESFKNWYNSEDLDQYDALLPSKARKWPKSSFKREYIKYLISSDKYFVFPRKSYVTNFGDAGEHFKKSDYSFQRPIILQSKTSEGIGFVHFDDSLAVYDAHMEISPQSLRILNPKLDKYDFTVDLYGSKSRNNLGSGYVLTSKKVNKALLTFGRVVFPQDANVALDIPGSVFSLAKLEDVKKRDKSFSNYLEVHKYDSSFTSSLKLLFIDILKLLRRI